MRHRKRCDRDALPIPQHDAIERERSDRNRVGGDDVDQTEPQGGERPILSRQMRTRRWSPESAT